MKTTLKIAIVLVCIGLLSCEQSDKRNLDLKVFYINVPSNWKYKKEKGVDSFVGRIESRDGVNLFFEYSKQGLTGKPIPDLYEYLNANQYNWIPHGTFFEPDVIYTSGDVKAEKQKLMEEKGITDSAAIVVKNFPKPDVEVFIDSISNNYKAKLTHKDSVVIINIDIPKEIESHNFEIDTIDHYRRKIIYPKEVGKGTTGIYVEDLESTMNFKMNGKNLSKENQDKVIQAFKTIRFKE